jgi:hypothetical protein
MKKLLVLLLGILLVSSSASAKRESSSEDATSVLLYGKYNDTLVPVKVAADGSVGGGGEISDTAYSSDWNGDTTAGASKNALYDKIETIVAGGLDFALDASTSGNIVYIGCSDDIQTAVTAASAGDTIQLGSCTYTISSAITVDKALTFIGQGRFSTIINTGTDEIQHIKSTADGLRIYNIGFIGTKSDLASIEINLAATTSTIVASLSVVVCE